MVAGVWRDAESWGLILGVFTPLAVAVVQQPTWPPVLRWIVGWACALTVGALTVLANGNLSGSTWVHTLALTLVASQAAYAGWRNGPAAAIERATSPSPSPPTERPGGVR
jgi:hypothetical protein